MIDLQEAQQRVGAGVVYTMHGVGLSGPVERREDGVITSVNSAYVFVRYRSDSGSKATRPEDLDWLA